MLIFTGGEYIFEKETKRLRNNKWITTSQISLHFDYLHQLLFILKFSVIVKIYVTRVYL